MEWLGYSGGRPSREMGGFLSRAPVILEISQDGYTYGLCNVSDLDRARGLWKERQAPPPHVCCDKSAYPLVYEFAK
jgi:hypothetical protein